MALAQLMSNLVPPVRPRYLPVIEKKVILFVTLLFLLVLQAARLSGQAGGNPYNNGLTGPARISMPFPAALVFDAVTANNITVFNAGAWQPDWPLEFPPDAFRSVVDNWVSITVTLDSETYRGNNNTTGSSNYPVNNYRLRRSDALILEFPFFFENAMTQVTLVYSGWDSARRRLDRIYLNDGIRIEILQYDEEYPSMLRVYFNEIYCFVLLRRTANYLFESWFDVNGYFLDSYEYWLLTEPVGGWTEDNALHQINNRINKYKSYYVFDEILRHFDSRFLTTGIIGRFGHFYANYFLDDLPRYWSRQPYYDLSAGSGNFSFQWDANGFLVRLYGDYFDSRYEYTLDERGNWIERREIRMVRDQSAAHGGPAALLVPAPGRVIRRAIEYKK